MPEPRADFTCRGKKCAAPEGAPVYELPVAAKRCPVCGSKMITRIWTPPHVSHGVAKHVDALVGPEFQRQQANRDGAKRHDADVREAEAWNRWGRMGLRVGPASQIGALAAAATGMPAMAGLSAGPAKSSKAEGVILGQPLATPRIAHEAGPLIAGRQPTPAPGSPTWTPPKK